MSIEFLNPAMLFGLAALSLPIVAHLLSKKRFDVVEWGAMQFLDLGKRHRRRVRIEELILLLLRMAIVGLFVLAMARPTISGGYFANAIVGQSHDTVFVIDGSYSMGRDDGEATPHNRARAAVQRLLNRARPGDTSAVLDSRDVVQSPSGAPQRDIDALRRRVDELRPPAGSSNLAVAIADALRILGTTSHPRRDVVVLTDGQARGWYTDDDAQWKEIDELRRQPAAEPRLWAVDFTQGDVPDNFSLERLAASRERAAVGFPVRVATTLRYDSPHGPGECNIYLEVDGQRLADATVKSPLLEPGGEYGVEFEHRFSAAGSHLLSVVIDDDDVPGDNRADVAVAITDPLNVVLVDGDPHLDVTRSETFFAAAALEGGGEQSGFIHSRVVSPQSLDKNTIDRADVIVLANVATVSAEQADQLRSFVNNGGGALIAPGRQVDPASYRDTLDDLLPGELETFRTPEVPAGIDAAQAQFPWTVGPAERDELTTARFSAYWKITPRENADIPARFTNGDPFLSITRSGRGRVALLSIPLDADGSTMPTKSVYVALLHELLFFLSAADSLPRNLNVGNPLMQPLIEGAADDGFRVTLPDGTTAVPLITGQPPVVRFEDTAQPGVYTLEQPRRSRTGATAAETARFVVNFDRGEADLTPLSTSEIEQLSAGGRISFLDSPDELEDRLFTDDSRTELWQLLAVTVLGLLCLEIWLTRRLVQGGHAVLDAAASTEPHPLHE
mgnify:CR=1 FL=1